MSSTKFCTFFWLQEETIFQFESNIVGEFRYAINVLFRLKQNGCILTLQLIIKMLTYRLHGSQTVLKNLEKKQIYLDS